jgi:hypothetical protein
MKSCTVSVIDGDGEPHQVAVNAASLFDAVDQAIQQWSRLWWFNAGAVAEVQAGNRRWRVRLRRVILWRGGKGVRGSVRLKLMDPPTVLIGFIADDRSVCIAGHVEVVKLLLLLGNANPRKLSRQPRLVRSRAGQLVPD